MEGKVMGTLPGTRLPTRAGSPPASRVIRPSLAGALDGLTQFGVLAFAAWTLVFDVGLVAHLGTTILLAIWAVCLGGIAAGLAGLRRPAVAQAAPQGIRPEPSALVRHSMLVAALVCGIGAGAAAGLHSAGLPWVWTPVLGLLSVAATGAWLLTGDTDRTQSPAPGESSSAASLLAAGVALGAAIFSLFIVRPDADDVYYVSRSVWVAQHGQIPVRDILFTNQAMNPIAGEPPISSIEVLNGALARLLGVSATSFTYYIAVPVLTFFAVWAAWLLIRRWARHR